MGLVLYSPADGDPSPSSRDPPLLSDDAHFEHCFDRHLPPSGTQLHDWRHGPSKARLNYRRQASWAYRYEFEYHNMACGGGMRESSEVALLKHDPVGWPRRLRPHQIRLLQQTATSLSPKRWSGYGYNGSSSLRGQRKSVRDACINEMAVYQPRRPVPDQSRSRPAPPVTTPAWTRSARRRTNRPPSLERQGAFRDASTTKRRMSQSSSDADGDEAELYSLGLLYDNEHACGTGFGLDTIVHDAPLYSISVTQGRSSRGRVRDPSPRSSDEVSESEGFSDFNTLEPLPELGLSFANLADDAALARFLQDEEMAAYLASVPEGEHDVVADWSCFPSSSFPSSSSSSSPVRVIYELVPEVEMEIEDEAESSCEGSDMDTGDWVMDMAGLVDDDIDDDDNDDDNILFRTDTSSDKDNDSNPDDTWLLLRP